MDKSNDLPLGYWNRVKEIRDSQNFQEFYSHNFSRYFSVYITAAVSYTKVTPNQITLSMILCGVIGGFLFSLGATEYYLFGGLFFILLNIADASDGELARFTGKVTTGGDYLDRVAHYVTNSLAFLGIGVGLFFQYSESWILLLAICLEIIYTFDEIIRDLLITCGIVDPSSNGGRKESKKQTRAIKSVFLSRLAQTVGTNLALFHIVPVLALIDLVLIENNIIMQSDIGFVLVYFVLFFIITSIKAIVRAITIKRMYF